MPNALDQLGFVTAAATQQVAFKALDALQGSLAGQQAAATAMLFLLVCQRYRLDPREVLWKGERVLRDALTEGRGEYVRAIKTYLKEETT